MELDWPAATPKHTASCQPSTFPLVQDALARELKLRTMKTNSGLVKKNDESVFDASSEDELLGEQNQWCPVVELCFHCTVGCVLVKASGVRSAMRVSDTCMFAILITPANRESQDKFFVVIKTMRRTKPAVTTPFRASVSFAALTHSVACRSRSPTTGLLQPLLASDPIIYAPWSVRFGTGKN